MPSFGLMTECNLSGEYTFYVAHTLPTETVTVCGTSITGTTYIRDEPIVDFFEVHQDESVTLHVPHVHPTDLIGNNLGIDLRLGSDSEITSVKFENNSSSTKVIIDTIGLPPGEYAIKLESIDNNSGVFSTLKTDTLTIVVLEPQATLATFLEELSVQVITSGQQVEWRLPPIDEG